MNIHSEKVQIAVPGESAPMSAWLAVPEGGGPHGAVMVFQEIFGVNAHVRDVTERVAREGYVAIAPDYHHRAAPDEELEYNDEGMKRGMGRIPKLTAQGVEADVKATMAFLRARSDVNGKIGCMGFCIGGHVAYLTACTTDVRATASFYGGGIAAFSPGGGAPTVTRTGEIKGRILCFFGARDGMISAEQVSTIQRALEDHRIHHEVVVYPQCGHAFFRDVDARVRDPEAASDSWERVKKMFAEELR
jgi:carboxymethylenebutenolidase